MRKAAIALFCVVVLIATLLLFPGRKQHSAFAAVSRAMNNIKTVHLTGLIYDNGKTRRCEVWIKNSSRFRVREQGKSDLIIDVYRKRSVEISPDQVLIRPLDVNENSAHQGLARFLSYFDGDFWKSEETSRTGRMTVSKVARPDGKLDTVFTSENKHFLGEGKLVIFVNEDTNLVTHIQQYDNNNRLLADIDRIEYDVQINKSVFLPTLPENVPVIDLATPISKEEKAYRDTEYNRLVADPNAIQIMNTGENAGGSKWTSIFHPGYVFESMDSGRFAIFYLPDKDMYRLLGTAKVYDAKFGTDFCTTVRNGDVRIPVKPQLLEILMKNTKPGAYRGLATDRSQLSELDGISPGDPQIGAFRFVNIGLGSLTIKWHRTRKEYIIEGRAKLLPLGEIYENEALPLHHGYKSHDLLKRVQLSQKLDYGGLPEEEIKIMKAELARQIALMNLDQAEWYWPDRGVTSLEIMPVGWELPGKRQAGFSAKRIADEADESLRFEPIGPTRETDIVNNRAKQEFRVIGSVRLLPSGKIVRNGVVTYDGDVISSE